MMRPFIFPRLVHRPQQSPSSSMAIRSTATAIIAVALASCAGERLPDKLHGTMTDPTQRHPITVTAERASVDVAIGLGDSGAEAHALLDATGFLRAYARDGRGPLMVGVPRHGRSRGALSRRLRGLHQLIAKEGISRHRVRTHRKTLNDGAADTITLSYERLAAVAPVCGDWSMDVTREADVLPYANYGCATQRNLATMVANPSDLVFPTREVPRGGDKRSSAYSAAIKDQGSAGGAAKSAESTNR